MHELRTRNEDAMLDELNTALDWSVHNACFAHRTVDGDGA